MKLCVDGCPNKIAFDPDEDRPKVEASERLLVGGRDVGVGDRPSTGDDPADQPALACPLPLSGRRPGAFEVTLEPSGRGRVREAAERPRQFCVPERLDQVCDMQAKEPDEERILPFGINWLTFIDGITDQEMGVC